MPFMKAKYRGTCVTCHGEIKIDDEIYWSRETGAAHRRQCPKQQNLAGWSETFSPADMPAASPKPVAPKPAPEKIVPGVYELDGQVYAVRMRKDKTGLTR